MVASTTSLLVEMAELPYAKICPVECCAEQDRMRQHQCDRSSIRVNRLLHQRRI